MDEEVKNEPMVENSVPEAVSEIAPAEVAETAKVAAPVETIIAETLISQPETITPNANPNVTVERTPSSVTITEIIQPTASAHENPVGSGVSKQKTLWRSFLEKVNFNKKKKLDRILQLLTQKDKVTNDDVEKLLKVSDATARRYLQNLENQGRIRQVGKAGKYTYYEKI